ESYNSLECLLDEVDWGSCLRSPLRHIRESAAGGGTGMSSKENRGK
ncbi:MAG: hypothetical protein K0Q86_1247, partial [Arthrobacter koreensis]|nr:hypothetical protein [Arthrobacter koreensis]